MVISFGAPAPPRRRLRRSRPDKADPQAKPVVPVTQLTWVGASPIEGDPQRWLESVTDDREAGDVVVAQARLDATRALSARRVAAADASVPDVHLGVTVSVKIGYGSGDSLVEGHFEKAVELPREEGRAASRAAALRPQERQAAILGGRESALAGEELLLRARADLDAGRNREAALQLRVALEALLAEREGLRAPGQDDDLASLEERRTATGEAANAALTGPLPSERTAEVEETVSICERVLRRRSALG
ncbi:hypothetical protein BH10ACT11_BH10ACT11_06200 [soil metagenome]